MSKDYYDLSDLDAILAEFREDAAAEAADEQTESEITALGSDAPVSMPDPDYHFSLSSEPEPQASVPEPTVRFTPAPTSDRKHSFRKAAPPDAEEDPSAPAAPAEPEPSSGRSRLPFKLRTREKKNKSSSKPVRPEKAPPVYTKRRIPWALRALLFLAFLALLTLVFCWTVLYLHPASGTLTFSAASARLRLSDKLDVYVNNAASDALGDLAYIRKIYTLQESDTVSPAPDPDAFGTTYDPADITALIQKASIMTDGQTMTFDPTADFVPDEPIRYYFDDTILVIAWKEYIEQRCCTFAEVKIAHGSQLRRKLAEDSYSSSVQLYASDMANTANAVVAINGDFYAFRDLGITVYQRNIYRNNPAQVDSCFFTSSGDMLFSRAGELMGAGEAERFVQENDVLFAVAFGPVLVDNGELQYCSGYPIGEINTEYSRSCIAMTDDLHYLLMTINHTPDARPRATINELARIIYSKNVTKAYALDGGQTAEIIMMGGPINHVDFGYERAVSDIIYFATAIPEEVR